MDTNYDWGNSIFKDSAGASLNRAANALADVLHTLAVQAIAPGPTPDEVAPTIAITSPQNGATLPSSAVTVTGTASDNVAVQAVQISLDGVTWVNAAGTGSWSASLTLVVGENTIHARATDTSGNAAATTISVTVRLSSTGPTPQGLDLVTASLIAVAAVCIVAAGVGFFLMKRKRSDHGRP
jgi:hypothetical protein